LLPQVFPDSLELDGWSTEYLRKARPRLLDDLELSDQYIASTHKLLEIGSIPPLMTAALKHLGRDVTGVDVAPARFETCIRRLGLDIRPCDIERDPLPFQDATFDVIMMNEVFEHLRIDLIGTMAELTRVLRPGGRLLLCTPNLASYRGYVNLLLHQHASALGADPYKAFSKLRRLGHMGHVREYTAREVADFLSACGLEPLRAIYRGHPATRKERLATTLRPSLSPYVTILAVKPDKEEPVSPAEPPGELPRGSTVQRPTRAGAHVHETKDSRRAASAQQLGGSSG
jgi:SAM-dependent methyltransferase